MSTGIKKAIVIGKSWGVTAGFEMEETDNGFNLQGQYTELYFDTRNEDVFVNLKQTDDISFESVGEELAEMRAAREELTPVMNAVARERYLQNR